MTTTITPAEPDASQARSYTIGSADKTAPEVVEHPEGLTGPAHHSLDLDEEEQPMTAPPSLPKLPTLRRPYGAGTHRSKGGRR